MKTYRLLPVLAIFIAIVSCGHSDAPCAVEVDMEIPAQTMGDSIAANMGCVNAAQTIVEWLASDRPANRTYAMQLTQRVAYAYADSMPRFLNAIDSVSTTLTPERRAKVLLRTCDPEYLGHLVSQDPNDSILVPIIKRVLALSPNDLARFRRGYQH